MSAHRMVLCPNTLTRWLPRYNTSVLNDSLSFEGDAFLGQIFSLNNSWLYHSAPTRILLQKPILFATKTVRLSKRRCTGRLQSVQRLSRLTRDWQHLLQKSAVYLRVSAVFLRVLAVPLRVLAVEATNSLENFSRIQLIYKKTLRGLSVSPMINSENRCHT